MLSALYMEQKNIAVRQIPFSKSAYMLFLFKIFI